MSAAEGFRVHFGNDVLDYRASMIEDPVPTGLQLLDAAGASPAAEHLLLQVLPNGTLESLRPEETVDLRRSGVEKFLIFRTDRSYRFVLNDRNLEWGSENILGITLKKLAGVDIATHVVIQDRPGGRDHLLSDHDAASLQPAATERFHTEVVYNIVVNGEQKTWHAPTINYEQIVKLAFPDGPHGPNIRYNVSWTKPNGAEGSLRPHGRVDVMEGMIFDVRNTDKS